ncbi:MAG: 50S ribosomal protein L18 [Candidatus Yanofskybacteria bacterium RIFCSPLOWO2_02_FULL_47_9b]|uniref:Large ribosomal subunit protein uL18 n=1 Tax=Candidatus Yanofskybacteria bacterium RIFCSPLOWO2_02_FULL_47_9b TaxID=1802708 RepID=A0A1F8H7Z2_9BACT|nr:MAG: 50S ribosomal protein L18 [Candidatus Yanofskybacteria bacterium RIFCSPLOWO2_02_FULL_47_9b]
MSFKNKKLNKNRRHARVRAKVSGTAERPRVAIFRSNRFTYAQVIDDVAGKTIISLSDHRPKKLKTTKAAKIKKAESASATGKQLAVAMKDKGIVEAVLDRGGFKYHGRVKAFTDGLREGGIKI